MTKRVRRARFYVFLTFALAASGWRTSATGPAPSLAAIEEITNRLKAKATAEARSLRLEEVLSQIGDTYPELRTHYILMHQSESRQKASYEFPRVITYAADGRFALTFNGDPSARGYPELEMYEFVNDEFRFRRIIFEPAPDYSHRADYRNERSYPSIKPINEALCKGCHGQSLRPNWEAYSRWEGAYPSDDINHSGEKYALPWRSADHDGFGRFFTRQATKGRYRFLQKLAERFVLPVTDRSRVSPSQFTQVAGYLNYRRIADLIRKSPEYAQFKYATFAALYDCANFEEMLPSRIKRAMRRPLSWYLSDTNRLFASDANRYHLTYEEGKISKLRFLYEGRDIGMEKWSMSFRRSPYTFVTPGGSPEGFISDILIEQDSELEQYRVWRIREDPNYSVTTDFVEPWTGSLTQMVGPACTQLKEASCAAFAKRGTPCE